MKQNMVDGQGGLRVKLTDAQMREQMLHPERPIQPRGNIQQSNTATTQIQISLGDIMSLIAIAISIYVIFGIN